MSRMNADYIVKVELEKFEDVDPPLPSLYRLFVKTNETGSNSTIIADGDSVSKVFGNQIFKMARRLFEDVVDGDKFVLNDGTIRAFRFRLARSRCRTLLEEFKKDFSYDELNQIFQEEVLVFPIMAMILF